MNDTTELTEPTCSDFVDEEVFKTTLMFGAVFTVTYVSFGFIIPFIGKKLLLGKLLYKT